MLTAAANGYFNAYGNAARKDKHDYVIHLGDYIYETGKGGERATKPTGTIFTLGDYRTRHGLVGRHCVDVGPCIANQPSTAPTRTCSFCPRTLPGFPPGMTTVSHSGFTTMTLH